MNFCSKSAHASGFTPSSIRKLSAAALRSDPATNARACALRAPFVNMVRVDGDVLSYNGAARPTERTVRPANARQPVGAATHLGLEYSREKFLRSIELHPAPARPSRSQRPALARESPA